AVFGNSTGMVIDVEVTAMPVIRGNGGIKITGIVEEEEMDNRGHKLKRTSSAKASVENVLTVLKRYMNIDFKDYEIHLNFPGGIPIDGPSAGITIATAVYSAVKNIPVSGDIAMTGELSIKGNVKPVGGVVAKVDAARAAGIKKVFIPKDNYQELFEDMEIEVIPVDNIGQVMKLIFDADIDERKDDAIINNTVPITVLTAQGT
ncbi:MAG: S16 family serine protease, partial [Ruminiclostridium sp.]